MSAAKTATKPSPLAKIRTDAGLTREDLARACRVQSTTIWRWETGRRIPTGNRVLRLARALGIKTSDLGRLLYEKAGA